MVERNWCETKQCTNCGRERKNRKLISLFGLLKRKLHQQFFSLAAYSGISIARRKTARTVPEKSKDKKRSEEFK
jgi:hypothetical protein